MATRPACQLISLYLKFGLINELALFTCLPSPFPCFVNEINEHHAPGSEYKWIRRENRCEIWRKHVLHHHSLRYFDFLVIVICNFVLFFFLFFQNFSLVLFFRISRFDDITFVRISSSYLMFSLFWAVFYFFNNFFLSLSLTLL